jgi:DNA-binding response OmpR family regulator
MHNEVLGGDFMTIKRPSILIVDDEQAICDLLGDVFSDQGYVCEAVNNVDDALARLKQSAFDVTLLDIKMPGTSGMDLLEHMHRSYPMTLVVMTTAVSDVNTAVEAMKSGASDYIVKPFTVEDIKNRVGIVLRDRVFSGNLTSSTARRRRDSPFQNQLDAIAKGVEAHVDQYDFHGKVVTEQTVEVAQHLGLPVKEIWEWASKRRESASVRERGTEWLVQTNKPEGKDEASGDVRLRHRKLEQLP